MCCYVYLTIHLNWATTYYRIYSFEINMFNIFNNLLFWGYSKQWQFSFFVSYLLKLRAYYDVGKAVSKSVGKAISVYFGIAVLPVFLRDLAPYWTLESAQIAQSFLLACEPKVCLLRNALPKSKESVPTTLRRTNSRRFDVKFLCTDIEYARHVMSSSIYIRFGAENLTMTKNHDYFSYDFLSKKEGPTKNHELIRLCFCPI